ncbi:terminase [Lactobacillus bombicola]|uniref:Terminase n=2 Tax=Lactobacillus bombicola TaxID=1505723 RepID=A0ABX9LY08_9LACO|nr:terminase [Lactobacillus bombicola]RHW53676.1 terminase [Lactobacillus bombicola]
MKYKDIAEKYGVSINTVKSWRKRNGWSRKGAQKRVQPKLKRVHTNAPTELALEELDNSKLTDRQKEFVLEYLRIYNATQAYINVYDVDYQTAKANGPRLLANARIQKEIKNIREARLKELSIEPFDLIKDVVKEAKADIGDYLEFGSWPEELKDKETEKTVTDADGNPVVIHHSFLYFKDKSKVDTSVIKKITKGKDGATIELFDKTKARDKLLEWLKDEATDKDTSVNINFNVPKEGNNASES